MAYLYRHIRLDKNEPFYIGIGSNELNNYKRAYWTYERNEIWNRIVAKTDYEVEIILDDLTWLEACEKEKEFIKLYGRKNIKSGTLANMTDGGDGVFGMKHSTETKEKIGSVSRGKILSEETRYKMSIAKKGRIVSEETKIKMSQVQKGKTHSEETKNKMRLSKLGKKQTPKQIESHKILSELRKKKVSQFDLNMNYIKTFESILETELDGFSRSCVCRCISGKQKQHQGYIFKYKNDNK